MRFLSLAYESHEATSEFIKFGLKTNHGMLLKIKWLNFIIFRFWTPEMAKCFFLFKSWWMIGVTFWYFWLHFSICTISILCHQMEWKFPMFRNFRPFQSCQVALLTWKQSFDTFKDRFPERDVICQYDPFKTKIKIPLFIVFVTLVHQSINRLLKWLAQI